MKEAKKWICLAIAMAIPLASLILVNIVGDTANLFHAGANKGIALSILAGNATHGVGAVDERGVKRALIENLPEQVDTLSLGPSLSMCVNKDLVGTDSFYNLGESSADYYDILAQFGLLHFNRKKFKRVILCADLDFMNAGARGSLHNAFMPYSEYMLSILRGENATFTPKQERKIKLYRFKTALRQLFSIQYFQGAAKLFFKQIRAGGKRYGIVTPENAAQFSYFGTDASWNYDLEYESGDASEVIDDAKDYIEIKATGRSRLDYVCPIGEHPSEEAKKTFNLLLDYLQSQGVEVLLFICPFSPALYDLYDLNARPLLPESEEFFRQCAKERGIRITGSYNPYNIGISDSDFYDSRHVRRDKLGKFFDFASR